jgi:hypothetical protein
MHSKYPPELFIWFAQVAAADSIPIRTVMATARMSHQCRRSQALRRQNLALPFEDLLRAVAHGLDQLRRTLKKQCATPSKNVLRQERGETNLWYRYGASLLGAFLEQVQSGDWQHIGWICAAIIVHPEINLVEADFVTVCPPEFLIRRQGSAVEKPNQPPFNCCSLVMIMPVQPVFAGWRALHPHGACRRGYKEGVAQNKYDRRVKPLLNLHARASAAR